MPHCIIEHSSDIDGSDLISAVHQGALDSELFTPEGSDIKVRAISYSHYKTGSVDISFVHVILRILSGRNLEQKSALSHLVLENLKAKALKDCSISVEIVDIDRENYAKSIV
ncbi:5-carboxymethyl-2-hydroxymuconate Delta-isomerase [Sessilibacter corallicola]|uniref:5-carboxymethyl-2-hydroxymuconate isomerase n=1 Tax=Sessilibacter corallicola TaxID=2904075 RepID=A0ABQ0A6D6_9GAMM